MKRLTNFMLGAIIGGILGGLTAILLAPTSGEQLRAQLQQRVDNIQIEIKEAAQKKRSDLEGRLEELKTKSSD